MGIAPICQWSQKQSSPERPLDTRRGKRKQAVSSKSDNKSFLAVAFDTLGWPVFGGCLLTFGFYSLISFRVIDSELVRRYFTAHSVEYIEVSLFFVGVAALGLKLLQLIGQFGTMSDVRLSEVPEGGQSVSDVDGMLQDLEQFPSYVDNSYLVQRLSNILQYVRRSRSTAGLDQELKHLSEMDAIRQQESYSLVRIIVWATPMLGFLGTVIGITVALGNLSPKALVSTPEMAMDGLLGGLSVAFDTTAVALGLSMVLMFMQFITNRLESELLLGVDARVERELLGRFTEVGGSRDPYVNSVNRMSESVLQAVESLVNRQADIWEKTLATNQERWDQVMKSAGSNIEASMASAFRRSLVDYNSELERTEEHSASRADRRWEQLQNVLTENARVMQDQQAELVKQGDLMLRAIDATGDVAKVQNALNENLKSLTMMGQFDETVMSLSAAINLLNSKLGASARSSNPHNLRVHGSSAERRAA